MTRMWLWILLSCGLIAAAFFGVCARGTAEAGSYFSALALLLHSLFGEEA